MNIYITPYVRGVSEEKRVGAWMDIHIVQGASALAVDTLAVVGPNDDIAQHGPVLQEEHGVGVAALSLLVARRRAAVPLLQASVEALAGGDGLDGSQGGGAGRGRESGLQVGVGRCEGCSERHGGGGQEGEEL